MILIIIWEYSNINWEGIETNYINWKIQGGHFNNKNSEVHHNNYNDSTWYHNTQRNLNLWISKETEIIYLRK